MTLVSALPLTKDDEKRLRDLASGLIRGIEDPEKLLERLDFTLDSYTELSETRMFRQMLREAEEEWEGAKNTHKRIKLKAAVSVEEALPHFHQAMISDKEPLSSKVKAMEVVSQIAGLRNPEPLPVGNGQFFKLEINLGGGVAPMVLQNGVENMTIDHEANTLSQSRLFDALPLEDL